MKHSRVKYRWTTLKQSKQTQMENVSLCKINTGEIRVRVFKLHWQNPDKRVFDEPKPKKRDPRLLTLNWHRPTHAQQARLTFLHLYTCVHLCQSSNTQVFHPGNQGIQFCHCLIAHMRHSTVQLIQGTISMLMSALVSETCFRHNCTDRT